MKKQRVRDKFLKELEKTPIVQVVCQKMRLSRQTYYRWFKEDSDFASKAEECISMGVDTINDIAQSNIIRGIQSGDKADSKYWLSHRDKEFRKPYVLIHKEPLFPDSEIDKCIAFEKLWHEHLPVDRPEYNLNDNKIIDGSNVENIADEFVSDTQIEIKEEPKPLSKEQEMFNAMCV